MLKSKKTWFYHCAGCDREPTQWCSDCGLAYCDDDSKIRHSVGAFENHRNIRPISRDLTIECQDCSMLNRVTALTFCSNCNQLLCRHCDDFTHNKTLQHVTHERWKYVIPPESWVFACSGCAFEHDPSEPTVWCHECNKAFCAAHNDARHSVGQYAEHRDHIDKISSELELACSDCQTKNPISLMIFCQQCELVFCMTCDKYAHHDSLGTTDHVRTSYLSKGWIIPVPDEEQSTCFAAFFSCSCFSNDRPQKEKKSSRDQNVPLKKQGKLLSSPGSYGTRSLSDYDTIHGNFSENNSSRHNFIFTHNSIREYSVDQNPRRSRDAFVNDFFARSQSPSNQTSVNEADNTDDNEADNTDDNEADNTDDETKEDNFPMEKLNEYMEMLMEGIHAVRFARSGRLDPVIISCNDDCTIFCYYPRPRFSTKNPSKRFHKIADITEIRRGTEPDPEYKRFGGTPNLRQGCRPRHAHRALSIIFPHKTIDLQFDNVADCEKNVEGLRLILEDMKRKSTM